MDGGEIIRKARRQIRRTRVRQLQGGVKRRRRAPARAAPQHTAPAALSEEELAVRALEGFPVKPASTLASADMVGREYGDVLLALMNRQRISGPEPCGVFLCLYTVYHRLARLFQGSLMHSLVAPPRRPDGTPTPRYEYLLECVEFVALRSAWAPVVLAYAFPCSETTQPPCALYPFGVTARCAGAFFCMPPRDPLFKVGMATVLDGMVQHTASRARSFLLAGRPVEAAVPWDVDGERLAGCPGYLYRQMRPAVAFALMMFVADHLSPPLRPVFMRDALARVAAAPQLVQMAQRQAAGEDALGIFRGFLGGLEAEFRALAPVFHESAAVLLERYELK